MEIRSDNRLENLSPEKRQWICEIAAGAARLCELIPILKAEGIEVSVATLGRFVRRHREQRLLNDAEDMKGAVDKLAGRGRGEALRILRDERLDDRAKVAEARQCLVGWKVSVEAKVEREVAELPEQGWVE